MNQIQLLHTLPKVFASRNDIVSDIWNQDVTFEKNKLYLVEANSGTGKSSLCSYIFGYRKDYLGDILFDQHHASQLTIQQWVEIRKAHIALLWQELRLFPELTAWENVQIKNLLTNHKPDSVIASWFEQLDIADKRDAKVGQMSFGQQQRVAMIRALAQPFDFLLIDEPISHLDDDNARHMAQLLQAEAAAQGAAIVATSIGKHLPLTYERTFSL